MSRQNTNDVSLAVRIVSFLLFIVGIPLLVGGAYLLTLGGTWYYVIAGLGMTAAAYYLWQGKVVGVHLYLAIFILTVVWALLESGFNFWPLVPRLLTSVFLCAAVLFITPLLKGNQRPHSTKLFMFGGFALMAFLASYIFGMFKPHDVILNSTQLASGNMHATSIDAGDNWFAYGRTGTGTRYAPFDEITPENVNNLEVAWTTRTGFIADQTNSEQDQTVPIYVDGTLYHCGPVGQITAMEGTTGNIKWQFDPKATSTDWKRCRSIGYFDPGPDDACGPRIVETTVDSRLISIKADDGKPCETFGKDGTVDIWAGMGDTDEEYYTSSSGPLVAGDVIVISGRVTDNVTVGEPSGVIRGYDAKTGALLWAWDLGNPSLKGLPPEGESYTPGTPNAWSLLAYDLELGMVYLPLGNATPDIYGGKRRPFDDEYSSSVVALDLKTGDEVWKFQTVHHDLWDYDVPAQPVLADIPDGNGGTVPALIQTTKRAQVFVLDRRTGKPVKNVEELIVPNSDGTIQGEYYAPTQPYSTEMAAIGTDRLTEEQMWGATPIDQMMCRILLHKYRYEGEFTTPSIHNSIVFPGPMGGMNFGSAAVDEERLVMVTSEMRVPLVQKLIPRDQVTPDLKYTGESGPYAPMSGTPYGMQRGMFVSPIGIPCLQPPWGTISAIDLVSGKHLWQHPAGTAKDLALGTFQPGLGFYVGIPPLGGAMVTKGGLAWFAATQDYYLRAFNTETGELIWRGRLPLGTQATPMSYVGDDGRQYIVISASGARYNMTEFGDYVIAYALPDQ